MNLLLGVGVGLLAYSPITASANTSPPVGYARTTVQSGTTIVSSNLFAAKVFQGPAIDKRPSESDPTLTDLEFSGNPFEGLSLGREYGFPGRGVRGPRRVPRPFQTEENSTPTHYVEILTGENTGLILDIVSNTGNVITVNLDDSLFSITSDDSICVRPHSTLGGIFKESKGLIPYMELLTKHNLDGSSDLYLWTGSGWLSITTFRDASNEVVYPGQAFDVSIYGELEYTQFGEVKEGSTLLPVAGGGALSLISPISPVDGVKLIDSNLQSVMIPYSDMLTLYSTDGALGVVGMYYYTGVEFVDVTTFQNADDAVIPGGSGVALNRFGSETLLSIPAAYQQ